MRRRDTDIARAYHGGVEFLESAVRDAGIGELLEGGEDEIADHPDKRQTLEA